MLLLHVVTKSWKKDLSAVKENIGNLVIQNHHVTRKHHIYFPNRLSSKKNLQFTYLSKRRNNFIEIISSKHIQ